MRLTKCTVCLWVLLGLLKHPSSMASPMNPPESTDIEDWIWQSSEEKEYEGEASIPIYDDGPEARLIETGANVAESRSILTKLLSPFVGSRPRPQIRGSYKGREQAAHGRRPPQHRFNHPTSKFHPMGTRSRVSSPSQPHIFQPIHSSSYSITFPDPVAVNNQDIGNTNSFVPMNDIFRENSVPSGNNIPSKHLRTNSNQGDTEINSHFTVIPSNSFTFSPSISSVNSPNNIHSGNQANSKSAHSPFPSSAPSITFSTNPHEPSEVQRIHRPQVNDRNSNGFVSHSDINDLKSNINVKDQFPKPFISSASSEFGFSNNDFFVTGNLSHINGKNNLNKIRSGSSNLDGFSQTTNQPFVTNGEKNNLNNPKRTRAPTQFIQQTQQNPSQNSKAFPTTSHPTFVTNAPIRGSSHFQVEHLRSSHQAQRTTPIPLFQSETTPSVIFLSPTPQSKQNPSHKLNSNAWSQTTSKPNHQPRIPTVKLRQRTPTPKHLTRTTVKHQFKTPRPTDQGSASQSSKFQKSTTPTLRYQTRNNIRNQQFQNIPPLTTQSHHSLTEAPESRSETNKFVFQQGNSQQQQQQQQEQQQQQQSSDQAGALLNSKNIKNGNHNIHNPNSIIPIQAFNKDEINSDASFGFIPFSDSSDFFNHIFGDENPFGNKISTTATIDDFSASALNPATNINHLSQNDNLQQLQQFRFHMTGQPHQITTLRTSQSVIAQNTQSFDEFPVNTSTEHNIPSFTTQPLQQSELSNQSFQTPSFTTAQPSSTRFRSSSTVITSTPQSVNGLKGHPLISSSTEGWIRKEPVEELETVSLAQAKNQSIELNTDTPDRISEAFTPSEGGENPYTTSNPLQKHLNFRSESKSIENNDYDIPAAISGSTKIEDKDFEVLVLPYESSEDKGSTNSQEPGQENPSGLLRTDSSINLSSSAVPSRKTFQPGLPIKNEEEEVSVYLVRHLSPSTTKTGSPTPPTPLTFSSGQSNTQIPNAEVIKEENLSHKTGNKFSGIGKDALEFRGFPVPVAHGSNTPSNLGDAVLTSQIPGGIVTKHIEGSSSSLGGTVVTPSGRLFKFDYQGDGGSHINLPKSLQGSFDPEGFNPSRDFEGLEDSIDSPIEFEGEETIVQPFSDADDYAQVLGLLAPPPGVVCDHGICEEKSKITEK